MNAENPELLPIDLTARRGGVEVSRSGSSIVEIDITAVNDALLANWGAAE